MLRQHIDASCDAILFICFLSLLHAPSVLVLFGFLRASSVGRWERWGGLPDFPFLLYFTCPVDYERDIGHRVKLFFRLESNTLNVRKQQEQQPRGGVTVNRR